MVKHKPYVFALGRQDILQNIGEFPALRAFEIGKLNQSNACVRRTFYRGAIHGNCDRRFQ